MANETTEAQTSKQQAPTGIFEGIVRENLKKNIPGLSPIYSMFTGESHHKTNIKRIFENLSTPSLPQENPDNTATQAKDWREKQMELDIKAREGAGIKDSDETILDAKIRNDIYVANIMQDQDIMREAVSFCIEMVEKYTQEGPRKEQIKNNTCDMDHLWPDNNDLKGSSNTTYRGYTSVAYSLFNHAMKLPENHLSDALSKNKENLNMLSKKTDSYTLEESMYILRAMGQLRDVMKSEKKIDGLIPPLFEEEKHQDVDRFNRINVKGDGSEKNRDNPKEHDQSRRYPNRYFQPLGTLALKYAIIYKVENPTKNEPKRFDYIQGTSGTTIDMINFFKSHDKDIDTTAKLMQAFYASWHAVSPDGNAHSQSESIGTMLQYLYRVNLHCPIMAPIKSKQDVDSLLKEQSMHTEKTYGNRLEANSPGYLRYQQKGKKMNETNKRSSKRRLNL
ncbi:hypothetical protein ACE939_03090 [Aquimarina sp. W85]|uniref:hypothetical protein n=1 Tax=Aquimarina rhodophyticola TaxID=3342246 RepID=UPI00366F471A